MRNFFSLLQFCCFFLVVSSQTVEGKFFVGQGSEDLVLDTFTGPARMIVSCAARRTQIEKYACDFWTIDPESGKTERIIRLGEPSGWKPHFHGMDLVKGEDGSIRLYVITHGVTDDDKRNRILVYALNRSAATLVDSILDTRILKSPNDVCALPDGTIYWTNDYGSGFGMVFRMIFRCKTSTIGKYDSGKFSIVAKKLQYANGILPMGDKLYVSTTRGNKLYEYELGENGSLLNRRVLAKNLKGLDNISFFGDQLIVTGHPDFGKFIKNMKSEKENSPSKVYSVSISDGRVQALFEDDGSAVSACSVAQYWNGNLWMGQVFNGWVFRAELPAE